MSRIVRFEREPDILMTPTAISASCRGSWDSITEESLDYDSCLSPSVGMNRSYTEPSERLSSIIENCRRDRSVSTIDSSGYDDYDSCLSPVHSPRWSLRDLDDFIKSNKDPSLEQLHLLLIEGHITHFSVCPSSEYEKGYKVSICPKLKPRSVIISGSFNPLHVGHEALARRALEEQGENSSGEYFFEMSTVNVDKGPLSVEEMEKRVSFIISRGHCCLLTNALLFDAKSDLFPDCTFAIGFDTYIRVINPKYYPRVTGGMDATMARIETNGCEFFVGGRVTEGTYRTLVPSQRLGNSSFEPPIPANQSSDFDLVELPPRNVYRKRAACTKMITTKDESQDAAVFDTCKEEPMSPIFSGISAFRHDISSTEIRSGTIKEYMGE